MNKIQKNITSFHQDNETSSLKEDIPKNLCDTEQKYPNLASTTEITKSIYILNGYQYNDDHKKCPLLPPDIIHDNNGIRYDFKEKDTARD